MKLEIFDFIDDTVKKLDERSEELEQIIFELEEFLTENLEKTDSFLNIKTRIKSDSSLKEKILRNGYYSKYETPNELFENLSDTIGIRLECRFIKDEKVIYKLLLKTFDNTDDEIYFYNKKNDKIFFKLSEKQPQKQKNGFKIYRIDGLYKSKNGNINFELQIKALVNIFWSEIEHKILYKNFNYVMAEDFLRDIMGSIKENLTLIDTQLMILYDNVKSMDGDSEEKRKNEIKVVLVKIVHTMYSTKIGEELGFVVDFRKSCESIMQYVFEKWKISEVTDYTESSLKILKRLNEISSNDISFDEYIEFEKYIKLEDEISNKIGKAILGVINKDFMWNLYFRILFDIETGNNAESFQGYVHYLKTLFIDNIEENSKFVCEFKDYQKNDIVNSILLNIGDIISENTNIELVYYENINKINSKINTKINKVKTYEYWCENKMEILEQIKKEIREILD